MSRSRAPYRPRERPHGVHVYANDGEMDELRRAAELVARVSGGRPSLSTFCRLASLEAARRMMARATGGAGGGST